MAEESNEQKHDGVPKTGDDETNVFQEPITDIGEEGRKDLAAQVKSEGANKSADSKPSAAPKVGE